MNPNDNPEAGGKLNIMARRWALEWDPEKGDLLDFAEELFGDLGKVLRTDVGVIIHYHNDAARQTAKARIKAINESGDMPDMKNTGVLHV